MKRFARPLFPFILFSLFSAPAHPLRAQSPDDLVTTGNSTGVEAFGSYAGLRENVNLQNRNLNIVVPLFTLTGRNGLSFPVAANYNAITRQWEEEQRPDESIRCVYRPLANTGSDQVEIELAPVLKYEEGAQADPDGMVPANAPRHNRYVLREMDGTRHEFRNAVREEDLLDVGTVDGPERFRSTGSTHMSLQESPGPAPVKGSSDVEIFTPDGRRLFFKRASGNYQIESIRDSNGNRITFQHADGQLISATDTLGRVISRETATVNGAVVRTEISYLTSAGQEVSWVLERNVPATGQDTLTLPGGLRYVFHYGPTPVFSDPCEQSVQISNTRLVRIDYPSGGWVEYDWGVWPPASPERSVLTAVRRCSDSDGTCSALQFGVWTYDQAPGGPVVRTRPDGSRSEHVFGIAAGSGLREPHELASRFYDADGSLLRTVDNAWEEFNRDPKVVQVTETLHGSSAADQARKTETGYDRTGYLIRDGSGTVVEQASRGNVLAVREYGWGGGAPGPLLRRTESQYLDAAAYGIGSPVHILDRVTRSRLFSGSGELAAQSDFFYDEYGSFDGFVRSLIGVSAIQRDPGFGAGYVLRGNLSRRADWLDDGADPVTLFRYDSAGNLRESRDANENVTATSYSAATQFAYIASITNALGHVQSFAYDYSSGLQRGLGSLVSAADANGRTTTMDHDILGRTVRVDFSDQGVERRYFSDLQASALHHQSGQPVFPEGTQLPLRSKTFTRITGFPFLEREQFEVADGLARPRLSGLRNGAGEMDWTQTLYDGNERVAVRSNPLTAFYNGNVPGLFFSLHTATSYDGLDRSVEVEAPDGGKVTTVFDAHRFTVSDESGRSRRSTTDGLGRVVRVREPDPLTGFLDSGDYTTTAYGYDPLGNIISVRQAGPEQSDSDGAAGHEVQSRSFRYDTLGRLREKVQPESGTTAFEYDAKGNLTRRTDARGRVTLNVFDALDRITSISYAVEGDPSRAESTPGVSYSYDGSTFFNQRGRLVSVTDAAGSSSFQYDSLGRISRSVRTSGGETLTADYAYNLLGGVVSASYQGVNPSPFSFHYGYDEQGRQRSVSDGTGLEIVIAHFFRYDSGGALRQTFYANGTEERIDYDARLRPFEREVFDSSFTRLMNMDYSFAANSNVTGINDLITGEQRIFAYDALNRLCRTQGIPWQIDYVYDRFGNRLSATGSASTPSFESVSLSVDPSTNRIVSPGWEYDAAGNVVEDGGQRHYRWDAAGRLSGIGPPQPSGSPPDDEDGRCTGPNCPPPPPPPDDPDGPLDNGRSLRPRAPASSSVSYRYDYRDRRAVKEDESGQGRIYFWDEVLGEVIWEFPLNAPGQQDLVRIFFNGTLAAENDTRPGGGLHVFYRDHLGTSKLMADLFTDTAVCDETYHPFGQLSSSQPSDCNGHVRKFTGKERDLESGLDYFGARFYDSFTGRFLSSDRLLDSAQPEDPRSWNRFAYVDNNPLRYLDPFGEQKQEAGKKEEQDLTKRTKEAIREQLAKAPTPADRMIFGVLLDASFPDSNAELAIAFVPIGRFAKAVKITRTGGRLARKTPDAIIVSSKQFDRKLRRRAKDLGFDPSKGEVREAFLKRISDAFENASEVRRGSFRGQDGDVLFFRSGDDVVVTKPDGEFITILTENGANNTSFLRATVVESN